MVVSRTRPGEHTLVMGDLNTLPQGYDAPLPSRRLLDEALRPDTHVCEYFARAGFTDVLAAHGVTSHTYPTPLEPKRDDFPAGVRLDYIMATRERIVTSQASWRRRARRRGLSTRQRRAWRRTTCRWWRSSRWRIHLARIAYNVGPFDKALREFGLRTGSGRTDCVGRGSRADSAKASCGGCASSENIIGRR